MRLYHSLTLGYSPKAHIFNISVPCPQRGAFRRQQLPIEVGVQWEVRCHWRHALKGIKRTQISINGKQLLSKECSLDSISLIPAVWLSLTCVGLVKVTTAAEFINLIAVPCPEDSIFQRLPHPQTFTLFPSPLPQCSLSLGSGEVDTDALFRAEYSASFSQHFI